MTTVVHPHFHGRRTGVTRHVEEILRALRPSFPALGMGRQLEQDLPQITMRELVRTSQNDAVIWHAHRNVELLAGLVLRAFLPHFRVVFTRHASHRPSRYTLALLRRADEVVALTEEIAGLLGRSSQVIGHGINLDRFRPPLNRAQAWQALGVGGERGIGVVGRIRPEKGQGDFVNAWSKLQDRAKWTALLVGRVKPQERAFAKRLADEAPELRWVDEQADVLPWYQGLSVLVQPSWAEGYSMVLLEAMASGCCVVASALPYAQKLVEHGRTGFLYPPHDVEGLAALLEQLLAAPRRVEQVGQAAAEEARARFGVEHEAQALARVYEALLTTGRPSLRLPPGGRGSDEGGA